MALIPPAYLNAVVSIGVEKKNEKDEPIFKSLATGFLIGEPIGKKDQKGQQSFRLFVVTNRHVFYDKKTKQFVRGVLFRFNTTDNKSHHFKVNLLNSENKPIWTMHDDEKVDLAVLPINASDITNASIDFYFFRENDLFFAKDFSSKKIFTGDGLFVLGFPMGISGNAKNFVIVRQGIIARVDEEVLEDGFYYIDASAYPGNSGGPVIIKPEIVSIGGTANNLAGLIGVISSGETYSDVAISQQTGEAKVVFTEQTGLVRVVPVERIYEIVNKITKSNTPAPEAKVEDASSEVKE